MGQVLKCDAKNAGHPMNVSAITIVTGQAATFHYCGPHSLDAFQKALVIAGTERVSNGPSLLRPKPAAWAPWWEMRLAMDGQGMSTRTLPTTPASTASCAAAISSSGTLCTGSSLSAPAARAAVMSCAAWTRNGRGTP